MNEITKVSSSITLIPQSILYLIRNTWLWKYILIPLIINIVLLLSIWISLFVFVRNLLEARTPIEELRYNLDLVGYFFIFILVAIVAGFITYMLATTVAAPFNGMMVIKILEKEDVEKREHKNSIRLFIKQIFRSLGFEFMKIIMLFFIFIGAYLVGLIPLAGALVATFITFAGNAFLQTLDFYDPILEEYDYSVTQKFGYLEKELLSNLGLLTLTGFIVIIPFVNIFFIPIGVLTATRSYINTTSN